MTFGRGIPVTGMLVLGLILGNSIAAAPSTGAEQGVVSFQNLLGWWSGTGRLGFKDGKREAVKCRATLPLGRCRRQTPAGRQMRQRQWKGGHQE
ncbi:MAG: hypothetical protein ACERJ2_06570 [Filomicrobium sp.]